MSKFKYAFLAIIFTISSARSEFISFPSKEVDAILTMNSSQMSQFFSSRNLDVFKFVDPLESQSKDIPYEYIASLKLVDRSNYSRYSELFDGSVLGFYFSQHNPTVDIERDTIVLSDKADRWTIAHEMSHALIDQQRPLDQKKNEQQDLGRLLDANEDYEEAMSMYRNFGLFLTEDRMVSAFDSIKVWTTAIVEFTYNYELEEVRIERYLESLYETRSHLMLDPHTYQRSFWYAERNCTMAMNKFNNAKDVVKYFSTLLNDKQKELMEDRISVQLALLDFHGNLIEGLCSKIPQRH